MLKHLLVTERKFADAAISDKLLTFWIVWLGICKGYVPIYLPRYVPECVWAGNKVNGWNGKGTLPLAHNLQILYTLSASFCPHRLLCPFSPLYGFIKNANEQWRLQSWQSSRWGQPKKKKKIRENRKAHRKTKMQTWNLCQGFRDWNLLLPLRYIEYE